MRPVALHNRSRGERPSRPLVIAVQLRGGRKKKRGGECRSQLSARWERRVAFYAEKGKEEKGEPVHGTLANGEKSYPVMHAQKKGGEK